MSSARFALSSLFGLVSNTANTAIAAVDTVNVGVSKVKLYADDSLYEQRLRSHGNRKDLKERVERDLIKRRAEMNMQATAYINQSSEHKAAYLEAESAYKDLWEDFSN